MRKLSIVGLVLIVGLLLVACGDVEPADSGAIGNVTDNGTDNITDNGTDGNSSMENVSVKGIAFNVSSSTVQNGSSYDLNKLVYFTEGDIDRTPASDAPTNTRLYWSIDRTDIAEVLRDTGLLSTKVTDPSDYATNVIEVTVRTDDGDYEAKLELGVGYTVSMPSNLNCQAMGSIYPVIGLYDTYNISQAELIYSNTNIEGAVGQNSFAYCSSEPIIENLTLKVGLDTYTVYPDGTWELVADGVLRR